MGVVVDDGRIVFVQGSGEQRTEGSGEAVDGRGRILLPGLIDSPLHLSAEGDLAVPARHGVTTGLDMASWPASFTAGLRGLDGPVGDLRSAGVAFIGPHGPHSHFGMPEHAVVTDPADVPAGVDRRLADGSDVLKVVTEPQGAGGPGWEVVRAVVKAAHDRGTRVVAHAAVFESFAGCLEVGVDVNTHVPTLTVAETFGRAMPREGSRLCDRSGVGERAADGRRDDLRGHRLGRAGGHAVLDPAGRGAAP